jgi:hypothetical protein
MHFVRRLAIGFVGGLLGGVLLAFLVVLLKPPLLVDAPRSEHPAILVALVGAPALAGVAIAWFTAPAGRPG